MNNDLISRSALLKEVRGKQQVAKKQGLYVLEDCYGLAEMLLKDAPAVDAEPVRHGIWTSIADGDMAECSECGECYDTETEGVNENTLCV